MAKFIKVEDELKADGTRIVYVNIEMATEIREHKGKTAIFYNDIHNHTIFNIPISDFMDLVNSQE